MINLRITTTLSWEMMNLEHPLYCTWRYKMWMVMSINVFNKTDDFNEYYVISSMKKMNLFVIIMESKC